MSPHGEARLVTEERWHHISRLVNEAFGKSETCSRYGSGSLHGSSGS